MTTADVYLAFNNVKYWAIFLLLYLILTTRASREALTKLTKYHWFSEQDGKQDINHNSTRKTMFVAGVVM